MPFVEIIAIILGAVIVATRLPVVLWPKQMMPFFSSLVRAARYYDLPGGLIILYFIWNEGSLLQLILGAFSIVMVVHGAILLVRPNLYKYYWKALEHNLTLLRIVESGLVLFGMLLIYLGYLGLQ